MKCVCIFIFLRGTSVFYFVVVCLCHFVTVVVPEYISFWLCSFV